ncbi:MAG: hypothetical protein QOE35_3362 [Actinomycetota bacterium]|jgi:hypothetical protein
MSSRSTRRPTDVLRSHRVPTVVLARDGGEVASWPLPGGGCADLAVVDHLARLQLAARRLGCSIHVRDAGARLVGLLELAGLSEVVPVASRSVEVQGEPEELEQVGVEEVVVADDPAV